MQPRALLVAWEAEDAAAFADCFVPEGVFHSPIIGRAGVRGRHAISELMKVVFASTSGTEFVDEFEDVGRSALRFRTRFGGRPVQGVLWLDLGPDGLVRELWVFVRPLTGVVAVNAAMATGLVRRESRILGTATRAGLAVLVAFAWLIDRIGGVVIGRLNRERSSTTA